MQERAQNKESNVFYSNKVDANNQFDYLIELTEESLNSKANYNGEVLDNTTYSIINKDLSRNGKEMIILGEKAPEYALAHKDTATEAILEYKKNLITSLEAKQVPEDKRDQLASMMINLNNQGLYIKLLGYMVIPKLMGEPFVPIGNTSYKAILRQEDDNYFIDAKIVTNVANIDDENTILTTLNINYTFDVAKTVMQLTIEDTKNYAEINKVFKGIFKGICKDLIQTKNSQNKDVENSLFASPDFDLEKSKLITAIENDNILRYVIKNNLELKNVLIQLKEITDQLSKKAQTRVNDPSFVDNLNKDINIVKKINKSFQEHPNISIEKIAIRINNAEKKEDFKQNLRSNKAIYDALNKDSKGKIKQINDRINHSQGIYGIIDFFKSPIDIEKVNMPDLIDNNYLATNLSIKDINISADVNDFKNSSQNKDVENSLFAADLDLEKTEIDNNRHSHSRGWLYTFSSLLLVVIYTYDKISSRNCDTGEYPPQNYTNSSTEQNYTNSSTEQNYRDYLNATRVTESIRQYPHK
jgi:hypothetical protein